MDFETASGCCATAGSGSTHGNSNVIREGSTPPGRQAAGMDLPATCLPEPLRKHENENANKGKYNVISAEGRESGSVGWEQGTLPGERDACNSSEKSDGSGSKNTGYTIRETQRVGRVDDFAEDPARSPFSGISHETSGAVRALKMMRATTPGESSKAPGQRSTGIESAKTVPLGPLASGETDRGSAISSSIVWTEFLNVSIPANVRTYEELFRCCVSPAASASPTSTGKTGSTTGQRKSSTGTEQGNASLSRFETLSTQPSHPRLYADDVADDSSPPLVSAALLTSAPELEQKDEHHHSGVCVGDGETTDEHGAAALEMKTDEAVSLLGQQQQAEHVAAGKTAEKGEDTKSNGLNEGTRGCSRNSGTTNFAGGALGPNMEELKGLSPLHVMKRNVQEYAASGEGDISASVQLPFPVTTEPGQAAQCTFVAQVASRTSGERDGFYRSSEAISRASVDGGRTERRNAGVSPKCGGSPAVIRQTSSILSPTPQTEGKTVQFDSTTGDGDAVTRSPTSSAVPATTVQSEVASAKVSTEETGGGGHTAEAEERLTYAPASDLAATRCDDAEEAAAMNCENRGTSASNDARRDGTVASGTDATPVASVVLAGTATSGENRMQRGGVVGGDGSTPVGPRGRPSLGAAGRQLLLDRIRAKYHTNVGLYSGVLRKNYNSTISKLPFFTVSLLHQLAADFGIDTNAVLEQQQQQHYDSTRGSSTRHSTDTGYPTGGRGARHGTFGGAAQTRGGAAGGGGTLYLRNAAADRRTLTGDSQGSSAYSTTSDKRRGRLHYESLTRRRCTRRATKKSGSTSDGALGSPPGERGESVCASRGARRRSLGLRTNRSSWEPEVVDSSPRRIQHQQQEENFFMGENMRMHGGIGTPEQDTRGHQRKGEKEHEQRNLDEYAGGRVVSRIREDAAPESEAWTEDQAMGAEVSSISTSSGTIVRARAVAIEKQREEPGQQSSTAHDEPHCNAGSGCTATLELLGSSIDRAPGDTLNQDKWRTVADVPLLVREQGRDQHRLLNALSNIEEGEENEERKPLGDVRILRARSLEGTSLNNKNEHSKWLSGATATNRLPATDSFREHQQQSTVEIYGGALSYSRRPPPPGDTAFNLWTRDGRVTNAAAVGAAEEKRRNNCPSHAALTSGGSGGVICGSAAGDADTLRTQTILKENVSACELPHARYLWSVLFGQLPEESGRAPHSAAAGQELYRTPAGGEKCEEAGVEYRGNSEKYVPHSGTADVSQQLTLMSRDRREMHGTANLHLAIPQPNETLAAISATAPDASVRGVGERAPLCRGREWMSRMAPANDENSYAQNATEGVSGAFAAVSGSETGVVAARTTDVERLLEADGRTLEAEHVRKRLKTEVLWPQTEEELRKTCPVLQPQPAPSSHSTRNYLPCVSPPDSSVSRGDRQAIADERILELLNRRGEEVPQGVGGGGGAGGGEFRDAANTCFLQKSSASTFKRGAADGQLLGNRIDCKPFTVTRNASEDPFSASRVRDGEGIQTCREEREEGWRESTRTQQKPPFAVRARNNGTSDREPCPQTEGRISGGGGQRVPFAPLTADEDACQRYQNGLNSSLLLLQQQEQCRGKLSLAAAPRKQSTPSACGSGEHSGTLEGYSGNPKSVHKRSLIEPLWSEPVDIKVGQDTPGPLASPTEPLLEQLTTSCAFGLPSSCRANSSLVGCTAGPSVSALDVKRHPQQLQQHERHRMLLYNRNKLPPPAGAKGHTNAALETSGCEPPSHGWLPRVATEGDASKGPHPSYGKRTDPSSPEETTGFKTAARDAWSPAPAAAQNTPFGDLPSDTVPLASLLLSSLFSEETGKMAGSNAPASVGSRYTSRVVALLQTLSELQRRLASMQLPPQSPQQQSNRLPGEPAGEARHSFSSPPSAASTPHPKEKLSPVQRVPNVNVPGILSSLLPALLQKADDRCGDAAGTGMRQRADIPAQQQLLQQVQQRKQEVVDASGGHGSWLNAKGGNEWTAALQEDSGPRGINCYGVGETSAPSCLRRQESADTPLALELVENFLKAQGLSDGCTSYPSERRPSLTNTSQDGGCGRHSDRSGRQSSVAVDSQGVTETSVPRKVSGTTNNLGETGSTSGTDDPPAVSPTDDKRVHIVKDELGNLHECCELQPPYARYNTLHASQQRDRYSLDHLETVKKKSQHEEEPVQQMEASAVNENKAAAVFADV